MSQKNIMFLCLIFFLLMIIVAFDAIVKKEGTKKNLIRMSKNILILIIVPTVVGIVTAYLGSIFFGTESNDWNAHISAADEQIMEMNGCDDLDEYYARVVESDEPLDTESFSPYFQRIDTTSQVKATDYKYRYIEIINKINGSAPKEFSYYLGTDEPQRDNYKLMSSNQKADYIDELKFYSKNQSSFVIYYLYQKDEGGIKNYFERNPQTIYEGIDLAGTTLEYSEENLNLVLKFYSEKNLNVGEIDKGYYREYLGRINYNNDGSIDKRNYYEQIIHCEDGELPNDLIIFEEKSSPELFDSKNKNKEKILMTNHKLSVRENMKYLGAHILGVGERTLTFYFYYMG